MKSDAFLRNSILAAVILLAVNIGVSWSRQEPEREEKTKSPTPTPIQYLVIPINDDSKQSDIQALLTLEGKSGWHLVMFYPAFSGNYFLFSKP